MNRNEIQRLMQERDKLITGLNNNLEADISTAQRDLLDLFMRVRLNGNLLMLE